MRMEVSYAQFWNSSICTNIWWNPSGNMGPFSDHLLLLFTITFILTPRFIEIDHCNVTSNRFSAKHLWRKLTRHSPWCDWGGDRYAVCSYKLHLVSHPFLLIHFGILLSWWTSSYRSYVTLHLTIFCFHLLGPGLWLGTACLRVWRVYPTFVTRVRLLCPAPQSLLSSCRWHFLPRTGLSKRCFMYSFLSHLDIGHPVIEMLKKNFGTFIAEDIELANRGLSHTAGSKKGQSEVFCS